jgi:hypothetical protein
MNMCLNVTPSILTEAQVAFRVKKITSGRILLIRLDENIGIRNRKSIKLDIPIQDVRPAITRPEGSVRRTNHVRVIVKHKGNPIRRHDVSDSLVICQGTIEIIAVDEGGGGAVDLSTGVEAEFPYGGGVVTVVGLRFGHEVGGT